MKLTTVNADKSTKEYFELRHAGNRAEYISGAHDDLNKDTVIVSTQSPKRQGKSLGVRRASVNFVRGVVVPSITEEVTENKDGKMEILASFPVGMSEKDFGEFCANIAGFFQNFEQVKAIFRIGKTY